MALAKNILKDGIVGGATGLGGKLIWVNSNVVVHGHDGMAEVQIIDRMIKGATVVDAIKLAKDLEPESSVIDSIETNGVPHCIRMKPDTPHDVLRWMRECASQASQASAGSSESD